MFKKVWNHFRRGYLSIYIYNCIQTENISMMWWKIAEKFFILFFTFQKSSTHTNLHYTNHVMLGSLGQNSSILITQLKNNLIEYTAATITKKALPMHRIKYCNIVLFYFFMEEFYFYIHFFFWLVWDPHISTNIHVRSIVTHGNKRQYMGKEWLSEWVCVYLFMNVCT